MHPLSGSDIATFLSVLGESGGIKAGKIPATLGMAGAILGRLPFTLTERLRFDRKINDIELTPPPIFILGHWRSGTTHLYNIMSKADFAYVPPIATGIPWDIFQIGEWFKPLLVHALPEGRYIDNVPVLPDSPQEDEIALANMSPLSYYHGIYFPKKIERHLRRGIFFDDCSEEEIRSWQRTFLYFLKKIYLQQDRKRLLIKNPTYTARAKMLRQLLPDAKFIHINRNPYEVFESMRNFYAKLLKQLALQDYSHVDIDDLILRTYTRMMNTLREETKDFPRDVFVEIEYEDLEADPLGQLEEIYCRLNIRDFELARPKFETYLSTVTSYKKNRYANTDEAARLVEKYWGPFLGDGRYRRPGTAI